MSFALLASVFGARNWSDESTMPMATWGTASGYSAAPDTASPSPDDPGAASPPQADGSPPTPAAYPGESERGRLRHVATGLCLDIRGDRVVAGAGTRLAVCSSAGTQQWSYEYDGLLRSLVDPSLCLDSHAGDGNVVLSGCVGSHADDVRYDITYQGELLPRWREELAVAPVSLRAGADVVVKTRSGASEEIWTFVSRSSAPDDSAGNGDRQDSDKDVKGEESGPQQKEKGQGGPGGAQQGPEPDAGDGTSGSGGVSHARARSHLRPAVRDPVRHGRRSRGVRARSGGGPATAAAGRGGAGRRLGGTRGWLDHGGRQCAHAQMIDTSHCRP